jgi:4-diphosphocytidyl-2-C-methyl-D-erythritol kinase
MSLIRQFAPAKLNLYLHVTGRKDDGYHDLDSLVAFATIGDEVTLKPVEDIDAQKSVLDIVGPQAEFLSDEAGDNLVIKAVNSLAELLGKKLDARFILIKNLPVASGIGGGSSDAAAALRALSQHWKLAANDPRVTEAALRHGQDVPVCLDIRNVYMTASGVAAAPQLPRAFVVLVNPGVALPTPAVYKEYRDGGDAFSPLSRFTDAPATVGDLVAELKKRGNDLYAPACRILPEIKTIITKLEETGALLARMSGSGATCFGIYPSAEASRGAVQMLRALYPKWWVEAGVINDN